MIVVVVLIVVIRKDTWRCFVAVETNSDVRRVLCDAAGALKDAASVSGDQISWTSADNWHVTLKFLGDVDKDSVGKVEAAMITAAESRDPFSVAVQGLMTMPPGRRAKVIAARVIDEGRLGNLAGDLDRALAADGFQRETRSFKPHLTLGRVRGAKMSNGLAQAMKDRRKLAFGNCLIDRIVLFRSELHPSGARYTALSSVALRADAARA